VSSSDNNGGCFLVCFFCIIAAIFVLTGFAIGFRMERNRWESMVTERGIAEWYADPKTGEKQLKYKCGEVRSEQD